MSIRFSCQHIDDVINLIDDRFKENEQVIVRLRHAIEKQDYDTAIDLVSEIEIVELCEVEDELETIRDINADLRDANNHLEQENDELKSDNDDLRHNVDELERKVEELEEQVFDLKLHQ